MSFSLDGDYLDTLEKLRYTISAVYPHEVVDIRPEYGGCKERIPCSGHGDAIITLNNGSTMRIDCTSVEIGALMWYFKCGYKHFTKYIDEDFASYLLNNVSITV